MSTRTPDTTRATAGSQAESQPEPAPRRVRARRNPVLLAGGAALVVVGAAGVAWLVTSVADTSPVLVAAHRIEAGAVIETDDLAVAQVSLDPAVAVVPATQRDTLIGQRAAAAMPAGQLLTPESTTAEPVPPPGASLVGVAVAANRLPAEPLDPGDPVTVVLGSGEGDDPPATAQSMPATVAGSRTLDDGSQVVDVIVPASSAGRLAGWVSTGRIVLVGEAVTP